MEINTYIKNLMASASNLVGVVKNKQWERLDSQNWNLENALELLQKEIDENPEFSAISDPLEEQPDKGWIPVNPDKMPDVSQVLWIADKEGYMYEEMYKFVPKGHWGNVAEYFESCINGKTQLSINDVGFYMFPQSPVKQG